MNYKHFLVEEREKIQEMLWQKSSIRSIARVLGRNPSSVSREIKRNKPPELNRYTPRVAHERAFAYRKHRGKRKLEMNAALREYVVPRLKLGWSPEQIAATAKGTVGETISHEAVYQYIYQLMDVRKKLNIALWSVIGKMIRLSTLQHVLCACALPMNEEAV